MTPIFLPLRLSKNLDDSSETRNSLFSKTMKGMALGVEKLDIVIG